MDPAILRAISVWALPVLFAITLHEAAHGYVAYKLGDPTAKMLGRITMNPVKHVDLFGTVILPLTLALTKMPFIFGWAKPVPIDTRYFPRPRKYMAIVALAGPGTNIILAFFSAFMAKFLSILPGDFGQWIVVNFTNSIFINVILAVFNMLPILPLDGGRVLNGFLPRSWSDQFERTERYGIFIVLFLLLGLPWIGQALGLPLYPVHIYIQSVSGFFLKLIALLTGAV